MYLDFSGFNFTGTWGDWMVGMGTPGNTPSYRGVAATGSFSASDQLMIKQIWTRAAEKYVAFNVNVTTVDPAIAAGQSGTDSLRQAYYERTAKMMHTVIGGNGAWMGGGGYSAIGTTASTFDPAGVNGGAGAGYHTNWVFAGVAQDNLQFIGECAAHENGHGLGLNHQSDYNGTTARNEYSAGSGTGNNSYAPIMGNSYSSQRGTWRSGPALALGGGIQNDLKAVMTNNSGIGAFLDDGIGHTRPTATALPIIGGAVDNMLAKGFIAPKSSANPNPLGEANYTTDFFKFHTDGGVMTLTAVDGTQYITPGVADPGAMLKSTLRILDTNGTLIGTGALDASTMFETYSANLPGGDYYAQISSFGGFTYGGSYDSANYYDMGSYFLTGSGFTTVPEPGSMVALGVGIAYFVRRKRKK